MPRLLNILFKNRKKGEWHFTKPWLLTKEAHSQTSPIFQKRNERSFLQWDLELWSNQHHLSSKCLAIKAKMGFRASIRYSWRLFAFLLNISAKNIPLERRPNLNNLDSTKRRGSKQERIRETQGLYVLTSHFIIDAMVQPEIIKLMKVIKGRSAWFLKLTDLPKFPKITH